jgi:hypothetical protein
MSSGHKNGALMRHGTRSVEYRRSVDPVNFRRSEGRLGHPMAVESGFLTQDPSTVYQ